MFYAISCTHSFDVHSSFLRQTFTSVLQAWPFKSLSPLLVLFTSSFSATCQEQLLLQPLTVSSSSIQSNYCVTSRPATFLLPRSFLINVTIFLASMTSSSLGSSLHLSTAVPYTRAWCLLFFLNWGIQVSVSGVSHTFFSCVICSYVMPPPSGFHLSADQTTDKLLSGKVTQYT